MYDVLTQPHNVLLQFLQITNTDKKKKRKGGKEELLKSRISSGILFPLKKKKKKSAFKNGFETHIIQLHRKLYLN